jgi:hypothetical protein
MSTLLQPILFFKSGQRNLTVLEKYYFQEIPTKKLAFPLYEKCLLLIEMG